MRKSFTRLGLTTAQINAVKTANWVAALKAGRHPHAPNSLCCGCDADYQAMEEQRSRLALVTAERDLLARKVAWAHAVMAIINRWSDSDLFEAAATGSDSAAILRAGRDASEAPVASGLRNK